MTKIRTGQAPAPLTRAQFHERFNVRFYDPAFEGERDEAAKDARVAVYRISVVLRHGGWARSRPRRLDYYESGARLAADEVLLIVSHASGVVMPPRLSSNHFERTIDEHDHP